jgi:hypothetical protein
MVSSEKHEYRKMNKRRPRKARKPMSSSGCAAAPHGRWLYDTLFAELSRLMVNQESELTPGLTVPGFKELHKQSAFYFCAAPN